MTDGLLLYLVRHGETDSNLERRYAGWSDDPLNQTGRRQAAWLATRLRGRGVARVYSSPVRRAVETSALLADELGATVHTVHDLHEIELGRWKGLTEEEVAARWPDDFRLWRELPDRLAVAGRETLDALATRSMAAIDQIGRAELSDPDTAVVVVSHLAVIRVLLLAAGNRPLAEYHRVRVRNGEAHAIRWRRKRRLALDGEPVLDGHSAAS